MIDLGCISTAVLETNWRNKVVRSSARCEKRGQRRAYFYEIHMRLRRCTLSTVSA